jgi:hypothetical protein
MSKFVHGLGHFTILALNAAALYSGFIPGKYAPVAVAVQGLAHAILALVNHKG